MGKSLSVLALAMRTLDDGQEWARQQNETADDQGPAKYTRSTFIVVPSARRHPPNGHPWAGTLLTYWPSSSQQLDEGDQGVSKRYFRGIIHI